MKNIVLRSCKKMFKVEQNLEELNKIMNAISDKHDFLSDDNEETNNVQLEEEIYQQMNLIKLKDLNVLPLEKKLEENLIRYIVKWLMKTKSMRLEKRLTYMK